MGSERKTPGDTKKKRENKREAADKNKTTRTEGKPAYRREPAAKRETSRTETQGISTGKGKGPEKEKTGIKMPSLPFRPDRITLMLAGVLLLALIIRLIPALYSIVNGHVIFAEFDPYYHMRRIVYSILHFPAVNSYDSYVNYPYGYVVGWPPLFDLTAAAFSLIVGLGSPSRFTIEIASSLVPVIMGLLSIVVAYLLVKDVMNRRAALIVSLIMAVMLGSVYTQVFGYVGHHVLEVLGSLAMYLLFTRAVSGARGEGLDISSLSVSSIIRHKKPLAYAALAGVSIAAMIFSWDGAVVYIGVIAAYAFVQFAYDAYNKEDSTYLAIVGTISPAIALVIVSPFVAMSDMGKSFSFSFVYLSWFHIVFLLSMALFFVVLGVLYAAALSRKAQWYLPPLAVIVALAAALAVAKFALPGLYATLQGGVEFLTGGSTVLSAINEITPLYEYLGQLSYQIPWSYFSVAGLLAIVGLAAYLLATIPGRKLKNAEIFLIVWTAVVLALGIMQSRFVYLLSVSVAIFSGYLIYEIMDLSGLLKAIGADKPAARRRESPGRMKSSKSAAITPPMIAVLIVSALALLPVLWGTCAYVSSNVYYYTVDWSEACQWLNDNSPQTSYVYSADQGTHPEYGVMCWWDYGNFVLYEAERPAIANNFQTGVSDAAHYFIAQNETAADAIMDRLNAKYVMADYRMGSATAGTYGGIFDNMPLLAGDDVSSYYTAYTVQTDSGNQTELGGSEKYFNTMYARLFYDDGLGGNNTIKIMTSGLEHYQLLYATNGTDPVKVFEYVKGAKLEGTAQPGAKVELKLNLTAPDGEKTYYSAVSANSSGSFTFTVPYPTSALVGATSTGPEYVITSGNSSAHVQVSGNAVGSGETITAGLSL